MNRSDRRALSRLRIGARRADLEPARRREELRLTVEMCGEIRDRLSSFGIDPAGVGCLAEGDAAAAELAAVPDTPELKAADAELLAEVDGAETFDGDDSSAEVLVAEVDRLLKRWNDSGGPDLARDSLTVVYLWCITHEQPAAARGRANSAGTRETAGPAIAAE